MPDIAIKVENLSKMYRLGVINNGTLAASNDYAKEVLNFSHKYDTHETIKTA